jgi:3-hydroxybutyryl-CoA dehydratase
MSAPPKYRIGDTAKMTKSFGDRDLIDYAKATGNSNPIHCEDMHSIHRYKCRIVHGMLVAGLNSAVLGTKMPCFGAIYVSQNLKFLKPVYVDEAVTARVEITGIDENKRRLILATTCFNEKGDFVVVGEAVVIPPEWLS